jgi:hypothetical protein
MDDDINNVAPSILACVNQNNPADGGAGLTGFPPNSAANVLAMPAHWKNH